MKWNVKKINKIQLAKYKKRLGVSAPMASILINLGIDLDDAKKLLNDPTDLFDIDSPIYGIDEVANAILKQEGRTIWIFADYDVDGLTSGFILSDYLSILGNTVHLHYPAREDGYGLSVKWVNQILTKEDPKKLTVITVDNGITANEAISLLKKEGAQVYVIDHHEPSEKLPEADAICDAWIDRKYGTHLCAAAVVWKVITRMALLRETDLEEINDTILAYLPFVALATISDVMPPCEENRAIVQAGLQAMNRGDSTVISALKDVENIETIRTKDVAWTFAPELNACSRMGNIGLAADIFASEGKDKEHTTTLARYIKSINQERKALTDQATTELLVNNDFSGAPIIFADGSNYPIGLVGILANRLMELLGRPAIVYQKSSDDTIGYGSARAPKGVDIKCLVNYEATKGNAIGALGHAEACGVQILIDKIDAFNQDILSTVVSAEPQQEEEVAAEEPTVQLDAVITPDELTYEVRKEINSFGYTSQEIPNIGMLNVEVEPIAWETSSGKRHILFRMKDSRGKSKYAVAWNALDRYEAMGMPKKMNFSGTLDNGGFCQYCPDARLTRNSTMLTIDQMDAAQ